MSAQHSLGEAHDRSRFDRGKQHRQKQAFLRHRAGAARIQVPEGREITSGLWIWPRQYRVLGVPGRASGSSRRKVGSALLLYSTGCRRRRCVSRDSDGRRRHDNGAPGLRPVYDPDYYAAFIIDPDGYRIEAYFGPAET